MSLITITNAWISQVENRSIHPIFADLIIENGKITQIKPKDFQQYASHPDEVSQNVFNAGGRVITIPSVNFHDHIYSRLAKGLATHGPMDNFLQVLENLWWKLDCTLDLDMIEASAHMSALESIRRGVTYAFDHHASPKATTHSLTAIAKVFQQYGINGVFCFETSDRNGTDLALQGLEENLRFFKENHNSRFHSMMGLHASFTLKDETLKKAADIIHQENIGIHIHLCEDTLDREKSYELYGLSPIQRLTKFKLLNQKSILSHGIHLEEQEYAEITPSGSAIAYNPDSNLNNNVGLPVFNRVPAQIPILIGTDGMHADIPRSMKQLFLLNRYQGNDFGTAFQWIQKIYFDQLTFVKQYFNDFPSLQEGDKADLVIWDYVPPTPFTKDNFWGHYIYGILERPVHSVIQEGNFLMKGHQLQLPDEDKVNQEIYKQGKRLFEVFEKNKLS